MVRYFIIFILFIHIDIVTSQKTPQYFWPTDASTLMSSSFCEYRDGHYHSAIDIKTWVREGYKCFAIADGKVERIRVSPFGYGKVIYVRLNDGNTAIYAHLQRFNNKIEKAVRAQQLKNQKYRLNWYPKDLYVKKSEIIAYTGRTGIGVPHLHFEIRNKNGHPINPLNFYSQVKDKIRPRIQKLTVIPLENNATVNSSVKPQTFNVTYIRNGINVIKQPIYVKGPVGLMIKGFDQADGASNKYGFHETVMHVDGKETFRLTYDELDFATTQHIYTETYYPYWATQREVFHKLYIEPFNPLNFYAQIPGEDGSIFVGDKPRSFEITVTDFHGNKTILKGELIADIRPDIQVHETSQSDSNIFIHFSCEPFKDFKIFSGDSLKQNNVVEYFEVIDGKFSQPESGLILKTKVLIKNQKYLRMQITGKNNLTSFQVISLKEYKNPIPETFFLGKNLVYNFHDIAAGSMFKTDGLNENFTSNQTPDGIKEVVISHANINEPELALQMISGSDTLWSDNIHIGKWNPGESTTLSWFDSSFTVTSATKSFLDTIIVQSDTLSADSVSKVIPTIGKIYTLKPGNIPVFSSTNIKIKFDSIPAWGNWKLFKTDGINSLSFVGGTIDTTNKFIKARTNPFGGFVIACDTIPPVIEVRTPVQAKTYTQNPIISFSVSDEHSGIGSEENISLIIDGEFVLPEWDPEDKLVTAKIDKNLLPGNHTLTISVKDQSDNITSSAIYFTIQ
jgi:hypothetical protein